LGKFAIALCVHWQAQFRKEIESVMQYDWDREAAHSRQSRT
jgi:hypothetical protein